MKIRSRGLWRNLCLSSVAAAMAIVPVVSMPAGTPAASTGEQRWVTQGRLKIPQSEGIVAVDFADSSKGIAVGIKGTVLRTVNAGEDWSPLPLPDDLAGADVTFTDVAFAGPQSAYIVGFSGTDTKKARILVSENGGLYWTEQSIPCAGSGESDPESDCPDEGWYLTGISFSDCSTSGSCYGHAVGGSEVTATGFILDTTNGGKPWFVMHRPSHDPDNLPPPFPPLLDVSFTDRAGDGGCENHCFGHVVGRAGTIYATSDGGSTWTLQCGFNSLAISSIGCGGLSSDLLETDFTGVSFSGDPDCPDYCGHVVAGCTLFFGILGSGNYPTDTNRTCSAADSWILATKDGGETWEVQDFPLDARARAQEENGFRLESVHFLDKDHGYVVGGNPGFLGYIAKTTNGGEDWVQVESGIPKVFTDVTFSDANTGHVVGQVAESSGQPGEDSEEPTPAGGHILKTADAGDSWELRVGDDLALLTGATFADPGHGWVVGTGGRILATSDGGLTWKRQQSTLTDEQLNAVSCASSTDCVAVGNQAAHPDTIVLTNDGGATWSRGRSGLPVSLSGVAYPGPQTVFAVGCSGSNTEALLVEEPPACAGGGVILAARMQEERGAPSSFALPRPAARRTLSRSRC